MTWCSRHLVCTTAILGLCGLLMVFPVSPVPSPPAFSQQDSQQQFIVTQGDNTWTVTPLSNDDQTVETFYNNSVGSQSGQSTFTTNGIERSNVSGLFLWHGSKGVSLVMIHDKPNDGSGGAVTFRIQGLPDQGEWVVQDERAEFDSATDPVPNWAWLGKRRDGGAFRGGLEQAFEITIHPFFNEQADKVPLEPGKIKEWQLLSGNAVIPNRTSLDMISSVTIRPAQSESQGDGT